jgi:hypothetical protein
MKYLLFLLVLLPGVSFGQVSPLGTNPATPLFVTDNTQLGHVIKTATETLKHTGMYLEMIVNAQAMVENTKRSIQNQVDMIQNQIDQTKAVFDGRTTYRNASDLLMANNQLIRTLDQVEISENWVNYEYYKYYKFNNYIGKVLDTDLEWLKEKRKKKYEQSTRSIFVSDKVYEEVFESKEFIDGVTTKLAEMDKKSRDAFLESMTMMNAVMANSINDIKMLTAMNHKLMAESVMEAQLQEAVSARRDSVAVDQMKKMVELITSRQHENISFSEINEQRERARARLESQN